MIALLGLWKAKALASLSGVAAQAIAVGIAVLVVIGGIGLGVWWLRHDARQDERREWQSRMLYARVMDNIKARAREKAAGDVAQQMAADWAFELATSEAARREAEDKLAKAGTAKAVAYPKDIIKAMNK